MDGYAKSSGNRVDSRAEGPRRWLEDAGQEGRHIRKCVCGIPRVRRCLLPEMTAGVIFHMVSDQCLLQE